MGFSRELLHLLSLSKYIRVKKRFSIGSFKLLFGLIIGINYLIDNLSLI